MNHSFLQSKWVTVLCAIAVVALALPLVERARPLSAARSEERRLDGELERLRQRQEELAAKEQWHQSPQYLERQARIQLNYQKPGEKVVFVYHPPTPSATATPEPLPRWRTWWYDLVKNTRD